jgi:hypothetical protein
MVRNIPFHHNYLQDGEDDHQIPWVFLSCHDIDNPEE